MIDNSHLNSLDFNSPRICGLIQAALHDVGDGLTLRQDLCQVLGTKDIAEGGGGQQAGGVAKGENVLMQGKEKSFIMQKSRFMLHASCSNQFLDAYLCKLIFYRVLVPLSLFSSTPEVLYIWDSDGWVVDTVVNHCINGHSNRVTGEDLGKQREGMDAEVK